MSNKPATLGIVGSVNLDRVARVAAFPRPGETVTGAVITNHPGGKGANQSLAARRLGAEVYLSACVGEDEAAPLALHNLRMEGVNLDHCRSLPGQATGQALILVNNQGENQIVVAPGANAAFEVEYLDLSPVDALIAQLEVPQATLLEAARRHAGFFCLNAAPIKPVSAELLQHVDLLVVNELEAQALEGLLGDFQGMIATTLGAQGARLTGPQGELARAASLQVEVMDTVGAGDCFTAALNLALVEGKSHQQALEWACTAAALATTREGAQSSPQRPEVDALAGQ